VGRKQAQYSGDREDAEAAGGVKKKDSNAKLPDGPDLTTKKGWEDVRGFALGQLRWSRLEYEEATLADLALANAYYADAQIEEWRRTRWLSFIMSKLLADPKKSPLTTPEAFLPLPGDEPQNEIVALSDEEVSAAFNKLREKGWKV
jgi:hypothetical protein